MSSESAYDRKNNNPGYPMNVLYYREWQALCGKPGEPVPT